jgi:hypothetical protein
MTGAMALLPLAVLELARPARRSRSAPSLPLVALVVAVLYFLWVALLATRTIVLTGLEPGITPEDWAVGGAVLMLLLLVLLIYDYQRQNRGLLEQAEAAPAAAPAYAPAPQTRAVPDELVVTAETWQGRRVLEYSRPPKSERPAAVYAKVLVPIDGQLVLRVEDLVAEARE